MRRPFYHIVAAVFCCLLSFNLHTQTAWNNASGDFKWFNAANWSNGLPAAANDATITSPSQVEIDLIADVTFDFNISSQGIVILNSNGFSLEISNNFDNSGPGLLSILDTDGFMLISGTFTNSGQIINSGEMEISPSGSLINSGFVTNDGVLTNRNVINNDGGNISNNSCGLLYAMSPSSLLKGTFNQNGVLYQIGVAIVQITSGVGITLGDINDTPSPVANCIGITVIRNLDANGAASINIGDINENSNADYCPNNIDFLTLSQSDFNCGDEGINTVTLTVKDGFGNTSTCDATIDIQDNSLPFITCPGPVSFDLLPGQCEIQVTFGSISAIDNCGNLDIDQIDNTGLSSGDYFPIGTTIIEFQVTDVGDNTDDCSFQIIVNEYVPASTAITCNETVNISLDNDCEGLITPDMVLEGEYGCYDDFIVEVNQTGSDIVDYALVGQIVTLTVTNIDSGNNCWGEGLVEDKLPPQVVEPCQDTVLNCLMNSDPVYLGGDVAIPEFEDCSFFDYYFVDEVTAGDCSLPFMSQIIRTWTATDENGRVNSCQQTITVESIHMASHTVTCPADYEYECNSNIDFNFSPEVTGYPTIEINGYLHEIKSGPNAPCGLTAAYSDIDSIPKCGIGYRIVRRWTIVDWCAPFDYQTNPQECFQVLDFVDHENPQILPPPNVIFPVDNDNCASTGILPTLLVNDCSEYEVVTITSVGPIQGNGGQIPFPGLGIGNHQITYRATDGCGNTTDLDIIISIIDDVLPSPICKTYTVVSVNETGLATMFNTSFDNGGYDNCCLDSILVRRMNDNCGIPENLEFGTSLQFCCADIFDSQMVEVKYVDCFGNYNTCMVETEVQDKKDPILICPSDLTIACEDDFTDFSQTGEAIGMDNCGMQSIDYEDEITLTCGVGIVIRTWTGTDMGGESITCEQTINVLNLNPFDGGNDIIWPEDAEFDSCDEIPAGENTGEPILPQTDICADLAIGFLDDIFEGSSGDYCKKIHRTWTVIDWCQYDANNPSAGGEWTYVQIIKLQDSVGPEITDCNNLIFCNFKPDCSVFGVNIPVTATDNCTPDNLLIFSWVVDAFNDGIQDLGAEYAGNGQNLANEYPNGTHSITYTIADDCGNESSCTFEFTIEDCKKPTVICDNLIVENMQGGEISINALQLITSGTNDNCTAFDDLVISFSANTADVSQTFSCDNLGENIVQIWVTDEANNQDFCETTVILQDNMDECSNGLVFDLGGQIENEEFQGIEEVMVEITGDNYFMNYTNSLGGYEIIELPGGEDYQIYPFLDADPTNGVTTFDILLLAWHILGTKELDSPYKLIAADANNSGSVTTFDIITMRKAILHVTDNFQNNTSWRFIDATYQFPNPSNPFEEPFPENINVSNLSNSNMANHFVAVKVGDLNATAITNNLQSTDDRTGNQWDIYTQNKFVKAGERVSLDFTVPDLSEIKGYQFTLNFNTELLQFVQLLPGDFHNLNNFGMNLIEEGALTASWDKLTSGQINNTLSTLNVKLFQLTFIAQQDSELKDLIHLNSRFTMAESFNETGETFTPALVFANPSGVAAASNSFVLYQNLPNPFKDATIIGFHLPEAAGTTLNIIDTNGRVVKTYENFFDQGYNEIEILAKDLPTNGVLFYQLETDTDIGLKKMIFSN